MNATAKRCGYDAQEVHLIYDALLDVIYDELVIGDEASLPNLARIMVVKTPAKEVSVITHPITGEEHQTKGCEESIMIKSYVLESVVNQIKKDKNGK